MFCSGGRIARRVLLPAGLSWSAEHKHKRPPTKEKDQQDPRRPSTSASSWHPPPSQLCARRQPHARRVCFTCLTCLGMSAQYRRGATQHHCLTTPPPVPLPNSTDNLWIDARAAVRTVLDSKHPFRDPEYPLPRVTLPPKRPALHSPPPPASIHQRHTSTRSSTNKVLDVSRPPTSPAQHLAAAEAALAFWRRPWATEPPPRHRRLLASALTHKTGKAAGAGTGRAQLRAAAGVGCKRNDKGSDGGTGGSARVGDELGGGVGHGRREWDEPQ